MSTYKPLITKCLADTYMIRNSQGEVYQAIGSYNKKLRKWQWQKTFITNMNWNPRYIMVGTFIHDIPNYLKNCFYEIQRNQKPITNEK